MNLYIAFYRNGADEPDSIWYPAPDNDMKHAIWAVRDTEEWTDDQQEDDEVEARITAVYPIDRVYDANGTNYAVTLKEATK